MASSAELLVKLIGKDEASKEIAGAAGKMQSSFSLARAAIAGFGSVAVGVLSDVAREGAADAASAEAMRVAWANASDQLGATTKELADNEDALTSNQAALLGINAEWSGLIDQRDALEAAIVAVTGSTKEDVAAKQKLRDELKAVNANMKENQANYKGLAGDVETLTSKVTGQREQVKSMAVDWGSAGGQLDAFVLKMRDTAAVDDSVLKPALTSLIATTGDYEKSITLAALAADIARGKNIDLGTAAELVGKVAMGNTSILKRYGITLDEGATSTEALAALQTKFGGQAEAYGNTTAGAMQKVSLTIGDFREELGSSLGPAASVIGLLPGMTAGFTVASSAVAGLTPMLTAMSTTLKLTVIPSIVATVIAMGPILLPIAAIGLAIGLLALAWTNNWGDIQGKATAAKDFILGAFESLKWGLATIFGAIGTALKGYINVWIDAINVLIRGINALLGGINTVTGSDIGGIGEIPRLARGGTIQRGGAAIVGEKGPELVTLPTGAQVSPMGIGAQRIVIMIGEREIRDFVVRIIDENARGASFIGSSAGPGLAASRTW